MDQNYRQDPNKITGYINREERSFERGPRRGNYSQNNFHRRGRR